jgi:cephalosporin-C deacetylase-like acetyl esterase
MFVNARWTVITLVLLAARLAVAEELPLKVVVATAKPEAVYRAGEQVDFQVRVLEGEKPVIGRTLKYRLSLDNFKTVATGTLTSAADAVVVSETLKEPGFLRCDVTLESEEKKITGVASAAVDPLEIKPSLPVPDDFDAFWKKRKEQLAAEPMRPKQAPTTAPADKVESFDVEINCPGSERPVRGYFAKPVNAKPGSLPIIITTHGAGVGSSQLQAAIGNSQRYNVLALDMNAHGIENGQPAEFYTALQKGELAGYHKSNPNDPDKIYFNGMFIRLMRAMEFMTAQPEWDGRTLIVSGSSQGAGQAIAAAGLDPRVTLVIGNVPAICDHTGSLVGRTNGWPNFLAKQGKDEADPKVVSTVRYFDAMNFGTRAKAEAVFLVGFIDGVTPPTSIYAMYNAYAGPKRIIHRPDMGHSGVGWTSMAPEAIKAHLEKQKAAAAKN